MHSKSVDESETSNNWKGVLIAQCCHKWWETCHSEILSARDWSGSSSMDEGEGNVRLDWLLWQLDGFVRSQVEDKRPVCKELERENKLEAWRKSWSASEVTNWNAFAKVSLSKCTKAITSFWKSLYSEILTIWNVKLYSNAAGRKTWEKSLIPLNLKSFGKKILLTSLKKLFEPEQNFCL